MINSIASMNEELQHRATQTGLVFECGCGGRFDATLAIVSDYPGTVECATKQPLSGNTGKFLFDNLRRYGITKHNAYITNAVKRKLVVVDGKRKAAIGNAEFDHWRAILLTELSLLPNLKYIACIGSYALRALLREDSITNWRGSVVDIRVAQRQVLALCANNPVIVFQDPRQEIIFKMDMGKLDRMVKGQTQCPEFEELINPTYNEAIDYIHYCKTVTEPISVDIETIADETACIGLAPSAKQGMCINFRGTNDNRYSLAEEAEIRCEIQSLFDNTETKFICQNGVFDAAWLWYKDRLRMRSVWVDTLLAHHTLYPLLPHNLGFLTAQYTDHPYYKDDGKTWGETGDIDQFWRYNVKDLCITRLVCDALLTELQQQGLYDFFFSHVMRLQPHLISMEVNGVWCDTILKSQLNETFTESTGQQRDIFLTAAREACRDPELQCNPNSVHDLRDLFFSKLKLVGRGTSTDEENRKRMAAHPRTSEAARTMLRALDKYKESHKFLSTYVKSSIDPDGRYRSEWKQYGTKEAPGRLSSSQTPWGTGGNNQNWPPAAKPLLIFNRGEDDTEASYFDAAQIEARIVAWDAKIVSWKHQFELARLQPGSYDAHCALASDMYKVPYDEVPKFDHYSDDWPEQALRGKPTIRYIAKRARHGLNYRMAPDRLASTASLPIAEAEKVYRIYHRTTPEIQQWWDDKTNEVRRNRRLFNAFGRRWILLEKFTDAALESIIAFYPQSTAGDHICRAIYLCHDDPRWPSTARMALNVHDALIAVHKTKDREIVHALMKQHGETPIYIHGEPLIVPVDFARTVPDEQGIHRWSTLRKLK